MKPMERIPIENEKESSLDIGEEFNQMSSANFIDFLREKIRENSSVRFSIVAKWTSVEKAREAKALLDSYAKRLHIDSIVIEATREQYESDINAFESGVRWREASH